MTGLFQKNKKPESGIFEISITHNLPILLDIFAEKLGNVP
jgi:hypothetical protein